MDKQETNNQSSPSKIKGEYPLAKREDKGKIFAFKNVTYREVVFEDMITAQRVCGKAEGNEFTMAIVAQVCEFDGKKATYEDLQRMRWGDFLELQGHIMDSDWMGSKEQLSSSLEKLGLI
jgi:hypothetical protein